VPLLPGSASDMSRKGNTGCVTFIVLSIAGFAFVRIFCGVYAVQPLGAVPDGVTAIVWRGEGEPFFNSPDALCLERMGGVSLLCRMAAIGHAPTNRIILRLPYQQWAYEASTGGKNYSR
jgi:hypothetical protein